MSIFRTIALFIYLFGYMIVHYGALRLGERALAAGDTQLVEELVNKNIPRWSRGILKVTGVSLVVEGLENIPKDTACVFVGNHRSYYDIPLLLASLDKPHGVLAKEELEKIPLLNRWMKLLGCVFVQRDDLRASVRALNDATAIVESGRSFVIFPEGTREKEGKLLPPKSGLFVIAAQAGVDVVPCRILYDTPDGKMHLLCKVRVIYGEPMPAAQFAMEGHRDTKKLRANTQALLDAWEKMGE